MTYKKVSGERIVAAILDAIIVGIIAAIPMVVFLFTQGFEVFFDFYVDGAGMPSAGDGYNLMMVISGVAEAVVGIIFFCLIPYKWNGQTLGKKILGIKAIDEYGENPSFKQHLVRGIQNWGAYITVLSLPLLYINLFAFSIVGGLLSSGASVLLFVSFILILVKDDGKGLHDMLANTRVVKADIDLNQDFVEKATQMGDWADVNYGKDAATEEDDWIQETPTSEPSDKDDDDEDPWKY